MKSQPLNMVLVPARLAPRTCSPSDRAGFLFVGIDHLWDCRIRVFDEDPVKALNDFVYFLALDEPGDTERRCRDAVGTHPESPQRLRALQQSLVRSGNSGTDDADR